jgi:proteasome lid subunit RPN8/RPN11
VSRRVEVDETVPEAEIAARVLNELSAHAREAQPEECCGLIFGDDRERFRRVVRCSNVMNKLHEKDPVRYPRDGRNAYFMSPEDYQQPLQDAKQAGERLTAVYHSHVDMEAYLSEMDVDYAEQYAEDEDFPFANAAQIVIAVFEKKVRSLAVFERDEPGRGFTGRRIRWGAS